MKGKQKGGGDLNMNASTRGCRLLGFSLHVETPASNLSKRICTEVKPILYHIFELERLFNMEGLLRDPEKGWRFLYTDSEDDMMVFGNDPWHEFCNVVLKIHLYTKEEVENANGDSKSCLAALMMEASKSSSVSQPDSSPTVTRV
ncbi:hypothetical protein IGI04_005242 [Brassica rapa subsp. trilocularis]|uniref:Auxin-responsive protein n=2 Tax=Brassica campestris TaxID=3711 RepID=M4DUQ0_BRACM|nr:hypothetical protein IGI04_005242 [Brassica rapa subsp. trilocularis]